MVKSRSLSGSATRPSSASRTGAADQVQLVAGRGERLAEPAAAAGTATSSAGDVIGRPPQVRVGAAPGGPSIQVTGGQRYPPAARRRLPSGHGPRRVGPGTGRQAAPRAPPAAAALAAPGRRVQRRRPGRRPGRRRAARRARSAAPTAQGRLLWSLPKGHIEAGETAEQAAVREVAEETGISGEIIGELGTIDFWFVAEGRRVHKTVRHFLLRAVGGELSDADIEVTEVAWVPLPQIADRLAYPDERGLVDTAGRLLADTA